METTLHKWAPIELKYEGKFINNAQYFLTNEYICILSSISLQSFYIILPASQ